MRVVIDTNVFVSALIRPGEAFSRFTDYIDRHAIILYSIDTLTELADVLQRRKFSKYIALAEVTEFVAWIIKVGELVTLDRHVTGSRDPKDNKFLSVAIAGGADYLISGDKDLLVLGSIHGIPILAPALFLARVDA